MKKVLTFVLTCALAASTMVATGCTAQQKLAVVQDIQKFIPVVSNVATAVCGFVPGAPICAGAVTAVSASAVVLDQALVNYYTALAAGAVPPSVIASLSQAISTFEADAGQILDAVRVLNPILQTEIETLVVAAQVLLAVVESLFPSLNNVTLKFAASKPAAFSLSSFVSDYNHKVNTCQEYMPRNISLKKIHMHSATVRVMSLGFAN